MNALIWVCLIPLLNNTHSVVEPTSKWELVWNDEFNYSGLPDSSKWNYESGYIRNNELQYYTSRRLKNARVENGSLIIESHGEDFEGYQYTSASLHNKGKGDWMYGKVEIRAKTPSARGTLSALWMLPTDFEYGSWLKSGEADLMECVGYDPDNYHFTVHTEAFNEFIGTKKTSIVKVENNARQSDFHTYSMHWFPDRMEFFMDGKQVFHFTREGEDFKKWPFNKKFYLIMSLAVGGPWAGQKGTDESAFPQQFMIDYVRIYKLKNT